MKKTVYKTLGNIPRNNCKDDVAIIVDPKETGEKGIMKELIKRFPELKDILEKGFTHCHWICLFGDTSKIHVLVLYPRLQPRITAECRKVTLEMLQNVKNGVEQNL